MRKLAGSKLKKFNKKHTIDIQLVFVLDNIEYARNVASIFNLAYALKVEKIYLTGITPTPPFGKELRKVSREREEQIHWERDKSITKLFEKLRSDSYKLISVAKTTESTSFYNIKLNHLEKKAAIIIGNEKQGLANSLLSKTDIVTYVPVFRPLAHLNLTNELALIAYSLLITHA